MKTKTIESLQSASSRPRPRNNGNFATALAIPAVKFLERRLPRWLLIEMPSKWGWERLLVSYGGAELFSYGGAELFSRAFVIEPAPAMARGSRQLR
jgi:hypothetical protein